MSPAMVLHFSAGLKEAIKNPPIMMPMRQLKLTELGRHLPNQGPLTTGAMVVGIGPRLDQTSRGPGDKSATAEEKKKKSSRSSINILQWNAEGLGPSKALELRKFLKDKKIHVALIQETKLKSKLPPSFPGYEPYKCNCTNTCQGILTLIKTDIQAEVSKVKTNDANDIHHIKIWHNGQKYTLYNVYSPPTTTFDAQLQEINFKRTILAGDTNGHSPTWGYEDRNPSGRYVEELTNTTNLVLLQDKNSKETLFHRPSGKTFRPDHTLISADIRSQCQIEVMEDLGSDHLPILITLGVKNEENTRRDPRWNYCKADWQEYRNKTDDSLRILDCNKDIDSQVTDFTNAILQVAASTIPRGNRKKYSIIWNEDIQTAVNERKKARKQAVKAPTIENKREYNRCSAKVKLLSRELKKKSWEKKTGQLDLNKDGKKAWTLLDKLSGKSRKTNPTPLETENGKATTDSKKADAYNKFYSSAKTQKRGNLDQAFRTLTKKMESRNGPHQSIFTDNLSKSELEESLRKCKLQKAPGPDKVSNEMIVNLSGYGRMFLLNLINKTWKNGKLPKSWKKATVIPILKKDKPKEKVNSYRPISLTSCIGKIAERMINSRIYWWLEKTQKLHQNQAGFRRGRQTIDQLIRLTQETADAFQKEEATAAVFVDLQQAYDHVWRAGLLYKMQKLGIQGNMYNWIKSFLQDRTIATKVNNTVSKERSLNEGIPQGSALSCTLFLIFINDLPDNLNISNAMFADDLVLWTSGTDLARMQNKLNQALLTISTYCELWKLKVNCRKTVYTIFTLSPTVSKAKLQLQVQGQNIEKEETPTYLGVRLDSRLTFKEHFDDITSKVSKRLNLLKRLASTNWGTNKKTLRQLYTGYVRAVFDYSAPLQVTASKYNKSKLDRKQNEALRFVCGGLRSTPNSACEIDANIEPLNNRRERIAALTLERFKRMDVENPCRIMAENWTPIDRIQKTSFLKKANEIAETFHFPEERKSTPITPETGPHQELIKPICNSELSEKVDKETPQPILKLLAYETIENYPEDIIHAYTDGSSVNAVINGGCGSVIDTPCQEELILISRPCGKHCDNYDAELAAIQATLDKLGGCFEDNTVQPTDIVIFSDSQSAVLAIDNWKSKTTKNVERTVITSDFISRLYGIDIYLQWIPAHCGVRGNEQADKLAKRGSRMLQETTNTPYYTARQVAKMKSKEVWLNKWINDETGRTLFKYQPTPNAKDAIHDLKRKDQCNVYRLRTGHSLLNMHRNRLDPQAPPHCRHCSHPYETVEHHLFHCSKLRDIREKLLPNNPDIENCLYSNATQLQKTSHYHSLALRVRKG